MNRPIKFRGTDTFTGEKRYGFYLEDEEGANILDIKNIFRAYLVDRDSVAQLVGRDANGEEIYEGDKLVCTGLELTAQLNGFFNDLLGIAVLK